GGLVPRPAARPRRGHLRQPGLPRTRTDAPASRTGAAARPPGAQHRPQRGAVAVTVPGTVGTALPRRPGGRRGRGCSMFMRLLLAAPLLFMPNMLHLSPETGIPGLNLANIVFIVVAMGVAMGGKRHRPLQPGGRITVPLLVLFAVLVM